MWFSFFAVAAQSPTRQRTFRKMGVAHLLALTTGTWLLLGGQIAAPLLGHLLLIAGIAEGAALVGWRLTQLPRSQALEFLLVSSLRPGGVLLAEALVGISRLALVTLAGLPLLVYLVSEGRLGPADLLPLLVMPLTWGVVTGLGLAVWAYETKAVRRWGERGAVALLVLYLGLGIAAADHLDRWVRDLQSRQGHWVLTSLWAFHHYNPFGVLDFWLRYAPSIAWERALGLEVVGLVVIGLLLARAASRLKGHFHDRHYRPVADTSGGRRGQGWFSSLIPHPSSLLRHGQIGNRPLSWWAVRRVHEYSGRINLWLAGGFGVAYSLYTVAGPYWPAGMGRRVFDFFDQTGGIPGMATALVILAAVPAAFQYGLWDSSAQDRCRRLELLLLTELGPRDYWHAAAAAAWRRGRGYFAVAVLLWLAAAVAGRITPEALAAAIAAGIVLWGLYFALGFRAFSQGLQANGLGMVLTIGLPLLAFAAHRAGWGLAALVLPPGSVYGPVAGCSVGGWFAGPLLGGVAVLVLARAALARCDGELRRWYERHHGCRVMD